jgi:tRNA-specific 2-thiouridylase
MIDLSAITHRFPAGSTIVAAMSGGVDSAVAAALLKQAGYDVVGVTLQIWQPSADGGRHAGCCSLDAVADARRAAARLGIPHYVLSFHDYFAEHVVRKFVAEYARGRTPNPCVECNRSVKFDELLRQAKGLGAAALATGHYAQVVANPSTGRYELRRGACAQKDQSYALYTLTQEQLGSTVFPLGTVPDKACTRQLAKDLGLSLAAKPDSQDICFAPRGGYVEYLAKRAPEALEPGPIVDLDGRVIGEHSGIATYTVGQRRRLPASSNGPLYVIALQPATRAVVVGPASALYSRECRVEDVNWVSIPRLIGSLAVSARIRYNADAAPARIEPCETAGCVRCSFEEGQRAITPGQAAVFYQGEAVVGGGTISTTYGSSQ